MKREYFEQYMEDAWGNDNAEDCTNALLDLQCRLLMNIYEQLAPKSPVGEDQ